MSTPSQVAALQALWTQYLESNQIVEQASEKVRELERAALSESESWDRQFDRWMIADNSAEQVAVARRLVGRLVRVAESHFAPSGGALSIPRNDVDPIFLDEDPAEEHWRNPGYTVRDDFTMQKVWDELAARYGGKVGCDLGRQQAAEKFMRAFGLDRGKPIKRRGARVVLNVEVYTEKCFSSNRRTLSYGCEQSVQLALTALDEILSIEKQFIAAIASIRSMRQFVFEKAARAEGSPSHFGETTVTDKRWLGALPAENTVPGWNHPRVFRTAGFSGSTGGTGSQAKDKPHALPWRVCAKQQV